MDMLKERTKDGRKFIPIVIMSLLFFCVVIGGLLVKWSSTDKQIAYMISNHQSREMVNLWYSAIDSCYYLFLPSFVDLEQLDSLVTQDGMIENALPVSVKCISKNDTCCHYLFCPDGHNLTCTESFSAMKSSHIPSLFLNTRKELVGKMWHDKNARINVSVKLFSPEGELLYVDDKGRSTLRGRGNSTWWVDKKPYTLSLDKSTTLLGLDDGKEWVLLANAFDITNMKNKLVYDFANQMDMLWNPHAEYVDLYLNGDYQGLYLLTEKIEMSPSRLNVENRPRYLLVYDTKFSEFGLSATFVTKDSHEVEIVQSDRVDDRDVVSLQNEIQRFEDVVKGCLVDSVGAFVNTVDIHSMVCRYLLDEIFQNGGDSWIRSNYVYFSGQPPYRFYGGPAWDYDVTMGGSYLDSDPECFYVQNNPRTYFYYLTKNRIFMDEVIKLYENICRPRLMYCVESAVDSLLGAIESSSRMNYVRWCDMFTNQWPAIEMLLPPKPSYIPVKEFLRRRLTFLDRHWINNEPYRSVSIELPWGQGYYSFEHKPENTISDYLDRLHLPSAGYVWFDTSSHDEYLPSSNVLEGMCLSIRDTMNDVCQQDGIQAADDVFKLSKKDKALVGLVSILLLMYIAMDFCRNRRGAHE